MRSGTPGLWRGAVEVARIEWQELWKHPGLYLFVPMILLQVFGSVVDVGAFDTPLLNTPGILAVKQMNTLTLLVCMLILFYTAESLQREKSTGLAAIHYATPLRTVSLLLGKCLANAFLGVAVVATTLVGCAIVLAVQHQVPFHVGPFALVWGLLLAPTFLLWTAFVCASFAVTGNRVGAYTLGLGAMAVTGFCQMRGKMTWAFNWDLWSSVVWSDLSVLELDRLALVLNRLLALGLTAFFVAVTVRVFVRREGDATRLVQNLSPGPLVRGAAGLAPFALAPLALFVALVYLVHDGRGGNVERKAQRDYWKRNEATWRDAKQPSLAAADVDVTLEPAAHRVSTRGTYTLVNRTDDTLRRVALTGGRFWRDVRWTMDGDSARPENRSNLYVFTPRAPLAPGGRVRIGYAFHGRFPGGISRNGGGESEFVLPAGAVLTGFSNVALGPYIGWLSTVGVEKDRNASDPREYPEDWWRRKQPGLMPMFDSWTDTRIRVTGPAAYQHNATGALVSEKVERGRRITEWRSDAPVRAFNVVLGHWQVKRRDGVAVYYDARHPYNVNEMLDALAAARRWYGEWFAPYPWRELRLSEFPGLATYAQGPPTNITFSENIGFLTKSEPKANAAFWITAHEAAHQWWPGMAMPGEGPGGNVLSEGLAHFSTILLTEQVRGEQQRMAFCRQIEDRYANSRQRDSERPLNRVDGNLPGDNRIIYDRGGWVFWMLAQQMGRDASLAAHRDYLARYRDTQDHPMVEDYLAVLREHAPDTAAFDAYTRQWILGTVTPQYQLTEANVVRAGAGWDVRARVKNVGTGTARVEIGATRGERFPDKRTLPALALERASRRRRATSASSRPTARSRCCPPTGTTCTSRSSGPRGAADAAPAMPRRAWAGVRGRSCRGARERRSSPRPSAAGRTTAAGPAPSRRVFRRRGCPRGPRGLLPSACPAGPGRARCGCSTPRSPQECLPRRRPSRKGQWTVSARGRCAKTVTLRGAPPRLPVRGPGCARRCADHASPSAARRRLPPCACLCRGLYDINGRLARCPGRPRRRPMLAARRGVAGGRHQVEQRRVFARAPHRQQRGAIDGVLLAEPAEIDLHAGRHAQHAVHPAHAPPAHVTQRVRDGVRSRRGRAPVEPPRAAQHARRDVEAAVGRLVTRGRVVQQQPRLVVHRHRQTACAVDAVDDVVRPVTAELELDAACFVARGVKRVPRLGVIVGVHEHFAGAGHGREAPHEVVTRARKRQALGSGRRGHGRRPRTGPSSPRAPNRCSRVA